MAAASEEMLQELQGQLTCSICWKYFWEPVTIGCGHSFCRACLPSSTGAAFSCPECRQVSQVRDFPLINGSLAELTELGKGLSSQQLQSARGQRRCATHHQVLEFFCEDDQTLLCESCCQTPEHGAHRHSPVQKAAPNCRKKIQYLQNCLQKHFKETKKLLVKEKRPVIDWEEMIHREYLEWDSFMWPQECHLERMKQEKKNKKNRLSQQKRSLQDLMLDLQEAECQPNLDLLREIKQLLERSKSVLSQRAKALIPELRVYPISGMIETLNHFRVDLRMEPTSACPFVILSQDLKSARVGQGWQVDTQHGDDSDLHIVLAEQAFSSGRQYWEVDVTQLPQWTLGIYTTYLRTDSHGRITKDASVFFLQCVKREEDYFLQSYPGSLNHRLKSRIPRVGLYLEYQTGILAFYDVLQSSLIYQLPDISFVAPVTPMFFPGPPLPGTKPGPMTLCPEDSHLCACCYSSL
ncbi:tripartite motif-containing protein 64-like [Sarcophilus harrisii]|uniref:tripartite motif-containing protein 64-like n=1 Tax=Sarcophilus harrisii TaxID=9305 RepID=UPI001301F06A|nr:tripartite motif-containing protein 64-like [Sarcophilus harrisii]